MNRPIAGEVRTTYDGFAKILSLCEDLDLNLVMTSEIDFSNVQWFDANMCSPLGAILYKYQTTGGVPTIINIKNNWLETILRKNGFLESFGRSRLTDRHQTTIGYQRFSHDSPAAFMDYVTRHFRPGSRGLPTMTPLLLRRFRQSIFDIFENVKEHSETKLGFFACGQFYPRYNRMDFCIADLGIGIRANIERHLGLTMSSSAAVKWAMDGNTTKCGRRPGGLGLKLIREFITLNQGRLILVSDRGYWEFANGQVSTMEFETSFPGTVVSIEINTANTKSYFLADEIDPKEIW